MLSLKLNSLNQSSSFCHRSSATDLGKLTPQSTVCSAGYLPGSKDSDNCRECFYLKQLAIANKTKSLGNCQKQAIWTGNMCLNMSSDILKAVSSLDSGIRWRHLENQSVMTIIKFFPCDTGRYQDQVRLCPKGDTEKVSNFRFISLYY